MKLVVIGGVAGGMSAAARARRLDENAQITVLEQGPYVSFANCGLPYHLSGEISRRGALLLHTPQTLAAQLNLDVRVNSRATAIDRAARTVTVQGPDGAYQLPYDALLLSPGATPASPPIDGVEHPAVFRLYTIPQLDAVMQHLDGVQGAVDGAGAGGEDRGAGADSHATAVVVGAGFIGLEAVEALVHRGVDVTLVEFAPHVLPPLDADLAPILQRELEEHGVKVRVSTSVTAIADAPGGGVLVTLSDGSTLRTDTVLLSTGVTPNTALARDAGLELGTRGAIVVDSAMRTSDPAIWAVGDAVQLRQVIGGKELLGPVPLAAPANRHGRLAADSIVRGTVPTGGAAPAVLGTAIVRVFNQVAAVTGASHRTLQTNEIEHLRVQIHPGSHAGYYPGAEQIHLSASFAPDGTLLGAQAVGRDGVDKRVDVLATAIKGGLTADDLADLDLSYAPPFGSAKDPVNMLAFTAQNILTGLTPVWYAEDLDEAMRTGLVLDVRSAGECATGMVPDALNVPHTQVRERLAEIRAAAGGRPVFVHCASGVRSHLATRILRQEGFDARNLSGGMLTLRNVRPDLGHSASLAPVGAGA